MGCQEKLNDHLPVMLEPRCIGVNDHAVPWHLGTGGEDLAPVVLHHAHPARAVCGQLRMIAERGKIDAGLPDHGQHVLLIGKSHSSVVDRHITHARSLLPFNMDRAKRT